MTGIYPQPNDWQCGPFALKHALLTIGIFANENGIARAAGTDRSGTDETELGRAAQQHHCALPTIRRRDPVEARRLLRVHLGRQLPVLLCINGWNHWVTVVREEDGQFVVFDSHEPTVVRIVPWTWLQERWAYHEAGSHPEALYDLHPLQPDRPPRARAEFTLERARYLLTPESRRLARNWSGYARPLLAVGFGLSGEPELAVPASEFLRVEERAMVEVARSARHDLSPDGVHAILDEIRFVAATYRLSFPLDAGPRARAILGAAAARHAEGKDPTAALPARGAFG